MLKNLLNKLLLNHPKIKDLNIKQRVLIESINDLDRQLMREYRRIEDAVAFDEKNSEFGVLSKNLADKLNRRRAIVSNLVDITNQLRAADEEAAISGLFTSFKRIPEAPDLLSFKKQAAGSVGDKPRVWFPTTPSQYLQLGDYLIDSHDDRIRYSRGISVPQVRESRGNPADKFQSAEDWKTMFTKTFKKEVGSLDKKLQGRVMEAVLEIAEEPTKLVGDTKKPLVGDLEGQWRYRVGDYRVVYRPEISGFLIIFLRCSSRGDVYH